MPRKTKPAPEQPSPKKTKTKPTSKIATKARTPSPPRKATAKPKATPPSPNKAKAKPKATIPSPKKTKTKTKANATKAAKPKTAAPISSIELGRLGLGAPQVVTWSGENVVIGTTSGAYVWELASGTTRQVLVGDVVAVTAAGGELFLVDSNQSQLVIAALDGTVRTRVSFAQESSRLRCGALSPDGRQFVVGLDANARVLVAVDTATGATVFRAAHGDGSSSEGCPACVAFSPNGAHIATADKDSESVWLWDAKTGKQIAQWKSPRGITALAFAAGGLVGTNEFGGGLCQRSDRFLHVYDPKTGKVMKEIDTPGPKRERGDDLLALAVSPDGKLVAVGGEESAVHIFDRAWKRIARLGEKQLAAVEDGLAIEVAALAFSPDGRRLAVAIARNANVGQGENEYLVEVWSTQDWKRTHLLDDCIGVARSAVPLPDGRLAVATDEGLRVYSGSAHATPATGNVARAACSPDGTHAVLGSFAFDGEGRVVELATGKVVVELSTTDERVRAVAYGDDDLVAIAHAGAWIFKVGQKTPIKKLTSHADAINGCAARGTLFAFASWDGSITWLDPTTKSGAVECLAAPGARRRLTAVAFSPDGAQLAVSAGILLDKEAPETERKGLVWIVDRAKKSWTPLRTPEERELESVTWSPDGVIAAGSRDGVLCRWDATTRKLLETTIAHGAWITALSSVPGRIYSASEDGTVGVWLSRP